MSEMEVIEDDEVQRKCFKCKETLYGSLNILQKDCERMFVLWNKYQIFLYEDLNFESVARLFIPEFQIIQIIVSNNYLVCIDCNGNVHVTSLKFKNIGQKRFKTCFQPREQGILYCTKYSTESTLSLKLQFDTYFLCVHKINSEFQLEKEFTIKVDDKNWSANSSDQEKYLVICHSISKQDFNDLSSIFKENVWKNHSLVLISFDKLTVYACLLNQKSPEEVLSLTKLYTSPTEICDMFVGNGLKIIIALICGTIIQLTLKNNCDSPEIIHLNTAISKVLLESNNSIIYSDGMTMWKAENIHSKEDMNFKQFFIKNVKDFIKCNNRLICTTFTNLIYSFSIENEASYLKQDDNPYCPADKLLKNSEYLYQIHQEIERNKQIIDKINEEGDHLTAISLSRRPEIINQVIQENVTIYENYEQVNEKSEVTLTEELQEYFKPELTLILVKITASTIQHNLSNILSNILRELKIHITLSINSKNVKTSTVVLKNPLKNLKILIPLQRSNVTQMNVDLEFVSEIPGALDKKQTIWTVLHRKNIPLHAEYFIKTCSTAAKPKSLKDSPKNIDEMIIKTAENQHGSIFKFTNISPSCHKNNLPFYVKLPMNFKEILRDEKLLQNFFPAQKASFIQKHLTSKEFLKSKGFVTLEIGEEKANLEILNDDFSNTLMKITCEDMKIASQIRNFFAKIFYNYFKRIGEEFISNALYTTTENLQKELKKCCSSEDCLMLAEQLQKNVIATLPL